MAVVKDFRTQHVLEYKRVTDLFQQAFWDKKLRLALLTLATFAALC